MRPTGAWDGTSFCHEAFCFADVDELRDRLVPFVTEGLEHGEPVAVVAGARARAVLGRALGDDTGRLAVLDAAEGWWRSGPESVRDWDDALRKLGASGGPFRVVGEPVWIGSQTARRWSRYEAACNRAWSQLSCYCLCLHDRTRLDGQVEDDVRATHPLVWDRAAGEPVPNDYFQDPADFVLSAQPAWRDRPAGAAVRRVSDPREARRMLQGAVPPQWSGRAGDAVLAAHELVINALREVGSAELATWVDGEVLVVEVGDTGPGLPDPLRGYVVPGDDPEGGRGLWVAWGLADDVAIERAEPAAGTRVQLFFDRP